MIIIIAPIILKQYSSQLFLSIEAYVLCYRFVLYDSRKYLSQLEFPNNTEWQII